MNKEEWQAKYGSEWQDAKVKEHCSARCPRCQGVLKTVEIHGHTQCVICKAVVDECCQGQQR